MKQTEMNTQKRSEKENLNKLLRNEVKYSTDCKIRGDKNITVFKRTKDIFKIGSTGEEFLNPTLSINTRKYPLRGYILGSGAPGTPGVIPKTYIWNNFC